MAERDDLEWLVIREFQGLWEAPNLAAPPNAAAVLSGCYPSASGLLPAGIATPLPNPGFGAAGILGMTVVSPVQRVAGGPLTADLWVAGQSAIAASQVIVKRYRQDLAAWETWSTLAGGGPNPMTTAVWFTQLRTYGGGTPPTSAYVFLIAGFNDANSGLLLYSLPSPSTPGAISSNLFYFNTAQVIGGLTTHQGRIAWIESLYQVNSGGPSTNVVDYPLIRFTDPNSFNVPASGNYFGLATGGSATSGFLVPTDVGDLLIARSRDVHLIEGDINAPGGPFDRVLSFFTGAAQQIPAVTPEGVFFGRADGPVVFWGGGAGTQDVSFGLKPGFWANTSLSGLVGAFAWSEPFVLAPNGYIFDTRTRAWFRHPSLVNAFHWAVPYIGVPFFVGGTPLLQMAWAAETSSGITYQVSLSEDPSSSRVPSWTWQSVPFTQEKMAYNQIREVLVLFQNWSAAARDVCQLILTVSSGAQAPGGTYTAPPITTVPGSSPQLIRFYVHGATEANQIKLSVGTLASMGFGNAGIVKEIRVGYRKASGLPRTGG